MRYVPTPVQPDSLTILANGAGRSPASAGRRTRSGQAAVFTAILALLGWLWVDRAPPAEPAQTDRFDTEPAPHETAEAADTQPSPKPSTSEQRYRDRARALHEQAVRDGKVDYAQVLQAAYEPGMVTPQILARKYAYRKRLRENFPFLADYRLLNDPVTVKEGQPVYDPEFRGWVRGMHSSAEGLIILTSGGRGTTLFHEAGHALQKHATAQCNVSDRLTYAAYQAGRIEDSGERRLRYLAEQCELEVSLQDLNRYHALVLAGRPIMDASEAITALTAIGLPLTYEEARRAFAAEKKSLTLQQFQQRWRHFPEDVVEKTRRKLIFPDARRLVELRELALQADPSLWPPLLRKLIFEAAGHL